MGKLSRKHIDNRADRYARRQESRAFYHTASHGTLAAIHKLATSLREEHGIAQRPRPILAAPVASRWAMTTEERKRLAAYNTAQSTAHSESYLRSLLRRCYEEYLRPLTPEEAERAYDETVPVPLPEARIAEIVAYATRAT